MNKQDRKETFRGIKRSAQGGNDRSAAEPEILATGNPNFLYMPWCCSCEMLLLFCSTSISCLIFSSQRLPKLLITVQREQTSKSQWRTGIQSMSLWGLGMFPNLPVKQNDWAGSTIIYKTHAPSSSVLTGHQAFSGGNTSIESCRLEKTLKIKSSYKPNTAKSTTKPCP